MMCALKTKALFYKCYMIHIFFQMDVSWFIYLCWSHFSLITQGLPAQETCAVHWMIFLTLHYMLLSIIVPPFLAGDYIYPHTPLYLKSRQLHRNFLILKNNSRCKPLVKISAFWFSDSIFLIINSLLTCYLKKWYWTEIWFDIAIICGLVAKNMAPFLYS